MQKLFKFHGLYSGEWAQNNLKISITSITPAFNTSAPYGYFTVQIRDISDSDNNPRPVETFADVNLNPDSPKFIGRIMGDSYTEWDTTNNRYITYGDYPNQSRYVRVELDDAIGNTDAEYLPFDPRDGKDLLS